MAHLYDILIDAENILDCVLEIHRRKEENLLHTYLAARTIQRFFRGYLIRKHLRMLHGKALTIQKHWRGFLGRQLYFKCLKEKVDERCKEMFNNSATIIQKVWRGYIVRKYIFNYHLFKAWKENLAKANKNIIQTIKNEKDALEKTRNEDLEKEAFASLQCYILKSHHLLRTFHRKGVLSRKDGTREYSSIEEILRSFDFTTYMRKYKHEKETKILVEQKAEKISPDSEYTLEKIKKLKRDFAIKLEKKRLQEERQKKKEMQTRKNVSCPTP